METAKLREKFRQICGREPRLFRAPGRVNLIGEHTDYNDGFVFPFAIDRETFVAGAARQGLKINVHALDVGEVFSFDLRDETFGRRGNWIDYVEGAARCVNKRFALRRGADLIFSSTVPIGAGLSSSAALEVSVGFALLALSEIEINRKELAFAAQEAEHEFVGVRSGIMDQFASVFGEKNHALLLDCRSLEIEQIPLEIGETVIAVCDSRVKHELAAGEYNRRRRECETGVEILREALPDVKSLRDLSFEQFEKYQNLLPEKIKRRCRHVVTENVRTLAAAKCLREKNFQKAGQFMFLSHESLRDDYEVSCPELDELVEIAEKVEGVFGARMTGGGFGGCTVNLLEREAYEEFQKQINRNYSEKFGFAPEIYLFRASDGASEII
ncbi:MAG: galactokinase [Pyrinomonadaceae bacterium]